MLVRCVSAAQRTHRIAQRVYAMRQDAELARKTGANLKRLLREWFKDTGEEDAEEEAYDEEQEDEEDQEEEEEDDDDRETKKTKTASPEAAVPEAEAAPETAPEVAPEAAPEAPAHEAAALEPLFEEVVPPVAMDTSDDDLNYDLLF